MPHFTCTKCGARIELGIIPTPGGFELIGEAAYADARERLVRFYEEQPSAQRFSRTVWHEILGAGNPAIWQLYICSGCGRLYIFTDGAYQTPDAIYDLAEGDFSKLLELPSE